MVTRQIFQLFSLVMDYLMFSMGIIQFSYLIVSSNAENLQIYSNMSSIPHLFAAFATHPRKFLQKSNCHVPGKRGLQRKPYPRHTDEQPREPFSLSGGLVLNKGAFLKVLNSIMFNASTLQSKIRYKMNTWDGPGTPQYIPFSHCIDFRGLEKGLE